MTTKEKFEQLLNIYATQAEKRGMATSRGQSHAAAMAEKCMDHTRDILVRMFAKADAKVYPPKSI